MGLKQSQSKYFNTHWTPPGWKRLEWQIMWRKLWLLSRDELRQLTRKLGTHFLDKRFQEKQATKTDFIQLIDDGVEKRKLAQELHRLLRKRGYRFEGLAPSRALHKLDQLLRERRP